jgi:hypothetical protein
MSNWIVTHSGRRVDPLAMRPEDIDIQDIAHALSLLNRFTGHTTRPYSVAEHSVRVSWLCRPENALWGLLHDASEAYLADIARPVKRREEFAAYREAEGRLMLGVCQKFRLPPDEPEEVKWADGVMCAAERRDLTAYVPEPDGYTARFIGDAHVYVSHLNPWDWETAKARFLDRFAWLVHRK